jgi:PAS domain S-box-containing protein
VPSLRVLILEDSVTDAELTLYELRRAGFEPEWSRVATRQEFEAALHPKLDLVLADYQLPQFDGAEALRCVQASGYDIPFLLVSGAIGEERAVELMRQGAADYLVKDRLARLGEAVRRALEQRRDRAERARAVAALSDLAASMEQQAKTFDTLLSSVPDLLALMTPDRRYTYVNRAFAERARQAPDAMVGRTLSDADPQLSGQYEHDFTKALSGRIVRGESSYQQTAGELSHYEYYFAPVYGDDGAVVAVACASRDITDRKRTEQMLRQAGEAVEQQRRWLEMVLDLLPLPVVMVEPTSGMVQFSNKAAQAMFGSPIPRDRPAYDVLRFADLSGNELPLDAMPAYRAAQGERLNGVEALWHTDTGRYHLSFHSEALPGAEGHPPMVVLLFQDISHLKQTEATLRESIVQLQRERELREIFVSSLSHDLRTPLAAARMGAELLARQEPGSSAIPRLQGRVLENIDRLNGMIETLLDANLIRAGEPLPLNVDACSLIPALQRVLDEYTTLHGDRFMLVGSTEVNGFWDARFLRRILENLLANAVKYGDDHAPIMIHVDCDREHVRIAVHNHGDPIAREDLASLFEPFRRGVGGGNEKRGWGIGLTLVRGAVEAHGGSVDVDSAPQRGTTFTVTLPLDARQRAQTASDVDGAGT